MKRFISYGSTPQFRQAVKDITFAAQYTHYDEVEDHPVTDTSLQLPTLTFTGTEKIHGTNAAVCYSNPDGFWVQSRKNIITPEKDNAGCATAAYTNEVSWTAIIKQLAVEHCINLDTNIISVFYEWAGGNVQKKSALTGLDKRAIIFAHFKVSPIELVLTTAGEECPNNIKLLSTNRIEAHANGIYNIMCYPTVSIDINFEEPLMSQNKMIEMVDKLEADSLVGKAFGIDNNIGEGYVFTTTYKDKLYKFKVKGEEHAKHEGKIKTLAPVDEEFEQSKNDFVNKTACITWRLEQMFNETKAEHGELSNAQTGIFLQKVFADVAKEESDTMLELGINPKSINGKIAKVAKTYYNSRVF